MSKMRFLTARESVGQSSIRLFNASLACASMLGRLLNRVRPVSRLSKFAVFPVFSAVVRIPCPPLDLINENTGN